MNLFVISDVHGMYKEFEELLTHWSPEDKLVLLGDLVDRGPQSLQVIQKSMDLKNAYGDQVVFCLGNHDKMLVNFIYSPLVEFMFYYPSFGPQTMQSFVEGARHDVKELNPIEQAYYVQQHFAKEIDFLKSGSLYEIIGNVLFTHAGFQSISNDLWETTDSDFLWIRDHYVRPNKTRYINVFGHTPTRRIHDSDDIWVSDDCKYIAIDGGVALGGQLNGLLLSDDGTVLEAYSVKSRFSATF